MPSSARTILNRLTTPVWPITVAGMVVGGAAGLLAAYDGHTDATATALVRLYQPVDPNQIITTTGPEQDGLQAYVSGEIAYLTSPGFADAVAAKLDEPGPVSVTAVQDGLSTIISLSTTQADEATAERTVNAAIEVYREHSSAQAAQRYQEAIDAISQVIEILREQLAAASLPPGVPGPDPFPNKDPQARITDLDLQRLTIEVEKRRGASMQVVQPPVLATEGGASTATLGAVGGGLLGGMAALGGALWWRRRSGVITGRAALHSLIENTLIPTVELGALSRKSDGYLPLARKLHAQLPDQGFGSILVLGASENSGSEYVTGLLASAVKEQVGTAAAPSNGPAVTVVDGGSIESPGNLSQALQDASQVVLVVMSGVDVSDEVRTAQQLATNHGVPISAICTHGKATRAKPAAKPD